MSFNSPGGSALHWGFGNDVVLKARETIWKYKDLADLLIVHGLQFVGRLKRINM